MQKIWTGRKRQIQTIYRNTYYYSTTKDFIKSKRESKKADLL